MKDNALSEVRSYLEEIDPGYTIDGVVFGEWGWSGFSQPPGLNDPPVEQIMTAEEAAPYLDQDWRFGGGFGAPTCYAVHIWSTNYVLFVREYDGSTDLVAVPRHPSPETPHTVGG